MVMRFSESNQNFIIGYLPLCVFVRLLYVNALDFKLCVCVRACVCACMHACMCVCMCACLCFPCETLVSSAGIFVLILVLA